MSRYWSDIVSSLTPYVPGEQPRDDGLIKLNTNESPYPPSPRVLESIQATSVDRLRLYPDPESVALRDAVARLNAVERSQVFVGNGSDEVLALAFVALLKHSRPIHFPDVSYSFYPVWAELFGVEYSTIPVRDDFSIDPQAYPPANGGIIVPNPNAPTGMAMGLNSIKSLLDRSEESVVVIDEAYVDFGAESAVQLINDYPNLLVVQTLSKSRALAGLRVGFALGDASLIDALNRVKNSFNSYPLDEIAQRAALASIEDQDYFSSSCNKVISTRESLAAELVSLGFEVLPSKANFVLVSHGEHTAQNLFSALRQRKILVRYFDKPRVSNHLRITVGTPESVETLLEALRDIVQG